MPTDEQIGLRIPEITKIMIELKERGYDVATDIYSVEQAVNEIIKLKNLAKKG